MYLRILAFVVLGLAAMPSSAREDGTVLLDETFSGYPAGFFSSEVGAHTEYHYLPEARPKGPWAVSTFRSPVESQRAWRIITTDGKPAMAQMYRNKYAFYHPMLVTGDPVWRDYVVEVKFIPASSDDQSGAIVRYRNDRCYYFVGVDGPNAVIKSVQHEQEFHEPREASLARKDFSWNVGEPVEMRIEVVGDSIRAVIGNVTLDAHDTAFSEGKVGITSDIPTTFISVRITTSRGEYDRIQDEVAARNAQESALQAENPKMKLWKKFGLGDAGVARNVRFGDLDGDGEIDVLLGQVLHHGPKDRNSELSCLTAMTFDGDILWQIGDPDPWKSALTNDVAFQIHDLDGDGKNDVIYCMNMEIVVADGATGQTKLNTPTPEMPPNTKAEHAKFPRILGDSMYFCDLRGTGRDSDCILKDRYQSLWAFDDTLNVLWSAQCNTGHYPYAYDVDNDGKDELMMGYTLFDDNGDVLWSIEDTIQDHADGVAIVKFRDSDAPRLLCAASDEGMIFTDMGGNILEHYRIGHVQNPAIADFRPDLPGLEAVSINFWGNQGIVHFYDADGAIYHDSEPCQHGSMCLPINWTGSPGEFWVLSANVDEGGMFDGWGRRVVTFPADGHPDMCNAVLDLTGDARDEVVVWDPVEMWIYTQDDNPKAGRLYAPQRNPLYNYSNYQATVSLPAWREGAPAAAAASSAPPIAIDGFRDGISHWQKKHGRDRHDPRYDERQIVEIADNMLQYQNPDGGWPKDLDWLATIDKDVVRRLRGHTLDRSTLDNHNTYTQVDYLARVYEQTRLDRFRVAAERGFDFILDGQNPSGGWRGADVDAITFNDGTMTGVMNLLLDIREGTPQFAWVERARREKSSSALDRAIRATLHCQIVVHGQRTGWCQQHDHATYAPVGARSYELPSLATAESVSLVEFLMRLPNPNVEVIESIDGAVAWLRSAQLAGIRLESIPIEPVRFENHSATNDIVVVSDPDAPPIWTRYYEIDTNRPFFANRDGSVVYSLAEVALERRTGYGWYGTWPQRLLSADYPAWHARHTSVTP